MSASCHFCGTALATTADGQPAEGFVCADCGGLTCPDCKSLAVGHEADYCVRCRG